MFKIDEQEKQNGVKEKKKKKQNEVYKTRKKKKQFVYFRCVFLPFSEQQNRNDRETIKIKEKLETDLIKKRLNENDDNVTKLS